MDKATLLRIHAFFQPQLLFCHMQSMQFQSNYTSDDQGSATSVITSTSQYITCDNLTAEIFVIKEYFCLSLSLGKISQEWSLYNEQFLSGLNRFNKFFFSGLL